MRHEGLIALIKEKGVAGIVEWRAGEDFKDYGLPLDHADFRGIDLCGADLSGASLMLAEFQDANLKNVNLSHTSLNEAKFKNAVLIGADFTCSRMESIDFTGCDLTETNFNLVAGESSCFRSANLQQAKLVKAKLILSVFHDANLSGTDLTGSDLRYSNLKDTNFSDAILDETDLCRVKWIDKKSETLWEQLRKAKKLRSVFTTLPTLKDKRGLIYSSRPGHIVPREPKPVFHKRPAW
ncbi:MAG: pentapeptide repeat-containing protein [Patescibacteria group bacterium]|jgi:hypothetical protein